MSPREFDPDADAPGIRDRRPHTDVGLLVAAALSFVIGAFLLIDVLLVHLGVIGPLSGSSPTSWVANAFFGAVFAAVGVVVLWAWDGGIGPYLCFFCEKSELTEPLYPIFQAGINYAVCEHCYRTELRRGDQAT
jgi:hypothetical protein